MDVSKKLQQLKFHFLVSAIFSLLFLFLLYHSPSFVTILSYFWPLLLSTAVFLTSVTVLGQISPPESETSGRKAGEELIGFVAGQPRGGEADY
ncbi:uncharacterized protein LOC131218467 [Magnolia sinica]|uniref:uncharacterized protein LOC131218467 n=1 Tax=Magnolia sinica TaxID=86752 RepID=UPI00265915B4|nr:uncharacterized protein LOC131218467 [Magnolia sinica]